MALLSDRLRRTVARAFSPLALSLLLTACGGGGGSEAGGVQTAAADTGTARALALAAPNSTLGPITDTGSRTISRADAGRFLMQSSFGPTEAQLQRVMKVRYAGWIDEQLALPLESHRAWWEARDAQLKAATPPSSAGQDQLWESFWRQAATADAQLRARLAFALSEIFVVSAVDGNVAGELRGLASWLDMLGEKGVGSYRELLEAVSLHPIMGLYLTSLHNQKANLATGRVPDENYAREVMQLFSIGLVRLNPDGTPLLVDGRTVDSYTPADIAGMARVFTGWSWACPAAPASSGCFNNGSSGGVSDPDRAIKPMVPYPQFHSTEAKAFLGVTIPPQTTADPRASLKVALDTLANHPNTGPFIGRQLIQRLVTSNPSPAYVRDVAAVFADNGRGARGDMKAVVKAILTHAEARAAANNSAGKLREPVLRLSAYLRAFPHTSDTLNWRVGNTDNASNSLGQTPLRAPSVFNFYRPGYVAPGTQTAAAGLVAPELQLFNETSVSGWVNYMRDNLGSGVGQYNGTVNDVVFNRRDLQRDWSAEIALAPVPADLVALVCDRLLPAQPSSALRAEIATAVGKIVIPTLNASGSNAAQVATAKRNRVNAALLLALASPEFLAQK